MGHIGATETAQGGPATAGGRHPDWVRLAASVRGPLLTLAVLVALDLLARRGTPVELPFTVLVLTVAYAAYSGGVRPALVSAALTGLYALHYFSDRSVPLQYSDGHALGVVLVVAVAAATAWLVVRLRGAAVRGRAAELERTEVEALGRRVSLLSQASATLASSLDYEVTLRQLARTLVPALADWCTIHIAGEDRLFRYVTGAHRDPARDLAVRALCEYGERRLPFGQDDRAEPRLAEVSDETLRDRAEDEEQLKLYRLLAPTAFIRVPFRARGRVLGMLTLVAARDSGRRFEEDDLRLAGELGDRAALAVDAGRLYREAVEANRRFRLLFEANPQPMWVFDVDSLAFLAVNDAAIRQYGYGRDEFLSMTIMDLRAEDDTALAGPAFELGQREGAALTRHRRKDGATVDMELVSHPLEFEARPARLVLATDISDRTRTGFALHQRDEQLRQTQRLDAVGRLASAVAHDFNNLLTTIRGFSDLLLRDLPEGARGRTDVEQIRKAADRGALLTGQLLAFGRQQSLEPRVLHLNQVIGGMESLIRRLLNADVQLALRLGREDSTIRIDPGHLEQVLVNLMLNARDAMPKGGTLTVATYERQIPRGTRARALRPGPYAVLAVRDTGAGMDSDALTHLFDPFYGANPQQRRTGLGLSIACGIVRQNGGAMRVSSEPGEGTTVKVYFPRIEPDHEGEPVHPTGLHGDETILVAEDEDGVREWLREVLTEHGHHVLEARHGRDALLVAGRYERPLDLLITDVVMPELGGSELVGQLAARHPGLKVLYISGYTNDEVVRRGVSRTETHFLQKPFTSVELMREVRAVLDGGVMAASR